jgi:hypothetical protein
LSFWNRHKQFGLIHRNDPIILGCLTKTSELAILVCMKTTLNIDVGILAQASRLTGVDEKTVLVRMGLEALVARYSARRLAALGGSEPGAKHIPRRRTT